jgi:cysteinyl-tRNA synthetase
MVMKIYNTLTRKREDLLPSEEGRVKIYSCGPTVYNYAHIGNWRSFIFSDILRRYLKYKGYNVYHVMNLTDVDDKTIRDSQKEGMSLNDFCEKYTKIFFEDMDILNIQRVEEYPKATDHIKEMVDITKSLIEKGLAYKSEDGSTYFSVSKFKEYGKLSKIKLDNQQSTERIKNDEYEKDSANDFALWKSYEESDGEVFWETELGKGRPGWHIECSAMSMKYLGDSFDIHTGGIDLTFPHHENEIAQSEGCSGVAPFVKYWMHCEHLLVDNEKMSKSKGNFFVLNDLLEKGHDKKAIRYLLLSTHYRQKLNYSEESIHNAQNIIDRFKEFISKLKSIEGDNDNPKIKEIIANAKYNFEKGLDDDLNISVGMAAIFDFMKEINTLISKKELSRQDALESYNLLMEFDKILGVLEFMDEKIPDEIVEFAKQRDEFRKAKNYGEADRLRDEISDKGYYMEDTVDGYLIKKK